MNLSFRLYTFLLIVFSLCGLFFGQNLKAQEEEKKTRIKIISADDYYYDEEKLGKNTQILVGDVQYKHKQSMMYCDSSIIYGASNSLKAYGNVRIEKGDSITVTGDSLFFDGNTDFAELRGVVTLDDGEKILETNYLDYDMAGNFAYYKGGGVLTNKKEGSVLKSEIGYFYEESDMFHFKNNVTMNAPDYDIDADTMHYNQSGDIVYFFGPTNIRFDSSDIYCERGFYDRKNEKSEFVQNAKIIEKERIVEGDSIAYNQKIGIGEVFCHSRITDTVNQVIIESDYAYLNEHDSFSIASGYLTMKQPFQDDTLYMHSDSMITEYDSSRKNRIIRAYRQVKFFKQDMQGKCDSLLYHTGDSMITMYHDPVIWSDSNQITGEIINIKTYDGVIDYLYIPKKSFVATEVDESLRRFNQIKGKELTAYFEDNEIYKIDIEGNGQTIYYTEEEDGTTSGMNRLNCSNMTIFIVDNEIDNIRFYINPEATMYPLKDLTEKVKFYDDFTWREAERPVTKDHIYFWETVTEGKGLDPLPKKEESEDKELTKEGEMIKEREVIPEDSTPEDDEKLPSGSDRENDEPDDQPDRENEKDNP